MNASQMAAYVVGGAERLTGPQLPVSGAEKIFEGFIERFGRLALIVAYCLEMIQQDCQRR